MSEWTSLFSMMDRAIKIKKELIWLILLFHFLNFNVSDFLQQRKGETVKWVIETTGKKNTDINSHCYIYIDNQKLYKWAIISKWTNNKVYMTVKNKSKSESTTVIIIVKKSCVIQCLQHPTAPSCPIKGTLTWILGPFVYKESNWHVNENLWQGIQFEYHLQGL